MVQYLQALILAVHLAIVSLILYFIIRAALQFREDQKRHEKYIEKLKRLDQIIRDAQIKKSPPKVLEGKLLQLKETMSDYEICNSYINNFIIATRDLQEDGI